MSDDTNNLDILNCFDKLNGHEALSERDLAEGYDENYITSLHDEAERMGLASLDGEKWNRDVKTIDNDFSSMFSKKYFEENYKKDLLNIIETNKLTDSDSIKSIQNTLDGDEGGYNGFWTFKQELKYDKKEKNIRDNISRVSIDHGTDQSQVNLTADKVISSRVLTSCK